MVPSPGLEPGWADEGPRDFKSLASAIPPRGLDRMLLYATSHCARKE